ncbi:recombinase family protein [Streptomyces sp. NPDC051286]|uniref:recombinase family protein n=1 Tax=Streptomyces sp. NPDC051286 TaxID=3365647 RepID=UPI0037A1DE32
MTWADDLSAPAQSLDAQLDSLAEAGVTCVFSEKISTRATRRPELEAAGEIRSSGVAVTLVVHEHKRLGRGIKLTMLAEELKASDVGLEFLTVVAAGRWHAAHRHAQQAEAARQTAVHLRAAYQAAAEAPLGGMHAYGQLLPLRQQRQHADAVRTALPKLAIRLQAEAGWPALAALLDQVQRAGHDSTALLRRVAAQRELESTESVSEVLVWRLYRLDLVPAK